MEKMLDTGFCLPAIGFAFRQGGRGYWIFKGNYLFLSSIQYPVSAHSDLNVRFENFVFLFPVCPG
jgi:hypothetical protein